jgi:molybdopterin-guanine dinucleotide biosynthesis protein A
MTSQGTEAGQLNRAFEHALRAGDLRMALATAGDLPFVSLERAARLLHLMAAKQSLLFDKAAARWIARYASEVHGVTAEQISDIANAVADLPDMNAAETLLAATRAPLRTAKGENRCRS